MLDAQGGGCTARRNEEGDRVGGGKHEAEAVVNG